MAGSSVESLTQDCYKMLAECVRTVNTFPTGAARDLFSTYTSFNVIVDHLSENMLAIANNILASQGMRETLKKGEDCMKILEKINDNIIDGNITVLDVQNKNENNPGCLMTYLDTTHKMGAHPKLVPKFGPKPQIVFGINVDNSPETVWKPTLTNKPNSLRPYNIEDYIINSEGKTIGYNNPYEEEIESYEIRPSWLQPNRSVRIKTLEETPYKYIETEEELQKLCGHLTTVDEIALDVEHHSFRSYLGLTCLLQISTETGGDFIVDVLKLRGKLQGLNVAFTNPNIEKIAHGAQNDVIWLQRDCGLYIVGLFDTYQACMVLKYRGRKLADLVAIFCHTTLDKRYQTADWSIRPLPEEQILYARMDTHYLIYIAAKLTEQLALMSTEGPKPLQVVYNNSRSVTKQAFMKPVINEMSYMDLGPLSLSPQSMYALQRLYMWRDHCARTEDESVLYVIPTNKLVSLAHQLPRDLQGIKACCGGIMSPIVKREMGNLHKIITECRNSVPGRRPIFPVHTIQNPYVETFVPHNSSDDDQVTNKVTKGMVGRPIFGRHSSNNEVSESNHDAALFMPPFVRYEEFRLTQ